MPGPITAPPESFDRDIRFLPIKLMSARMSRGAAKRARRVVHTDTHHTIIILNHFHESLNLPATC